MISCARVREHAARNLAKLDDWTPAEAIQARERRMNEQEVTPEILGVLRSMDQLKGKDPDELTEWLGKAPFQGGAECALREFASGERITTEGDFRNTFFILTRGTVSVTLGTEARHLATL